MKKLEEKKRREESPSLRYIVDSHFLSLTHSTFLPIFLPAFILKIRQIYFSVNRVEYNLCWIEKRKKKGAVKEAREKYIRTIFVLKKRRVEQNDAAHRKQ